MVASRQILIDMMEDTSLGTFKGRFDTYWNPGSLKVKNVNIVPAKN